MSPSPGARHSNAPPASTSQPHVVVVEYRAHEPHGHFQVTFAGFATGFAELGCTVDALTARGWSRAADYPDAPFTVRTMGWRHRKLADAGGALVATAPKVPARLRGTVLALADVAYNLAAIGAARRLLRRAGAGGGARAGGGRRAGHGRRRSGRPGAVLLLNKRFDPRLMSPIAGDGIWMTHPFGRDPDPRSRWVGALAKRSEARRRRRGGRTVVGVYPASQIPLWQQTVPWVDVAAVEVAGVADMPRPAGDRANLGVPDGPRLALVFGEPHAAKDLATAVQAFEGFDGWHLLVAGRSADWIADWLANTGAALPANVTLLPGPATEHTRLLAHHLADAAILSFIPGHRYDSGTLADAIAVGLPVVVSTPSLAAGTVERFAIGATFPAGDATALAAALQALPTAGDPTQTSDSAATSDPPATRSNFDAGFDAARHTLSFTTLAGIYLDAAGLVATTARADPTPADPTPAAATPLDGPPASDQAPT